MARKPRHTKGSLDQSAGFARGAEVTVTVLQARHPDNVNLALALRGLQDFQGEMQRAIAAAPAVDPEPAGGIIDAL